MISRFPHSGPTLVALAVSLSVMTALPAFAQAPTGRAATGQVPSGQVASGQVPDAQAAEPAPFEPLDANAQAQLNVMLRAWETQSKGTKTLECQFHRWHYDLNAAPAGVFDKKSTGAIRYAAPDRGSFKVDKIISYDGPDEKGNPKYTEKPGLYGEHWVCNGEELIEFDHKEKECKIDELPPEMRGQQIFNSPLPFVFNLDAAQIVERYWVRQVQAPKPGMILIEAYPKRQEDRAQYKLVQIGLNEKTFMPEALLMYAPNFNIKNAAKWDHYEFINVQRNSISSGLLDRFMKTFIDEKPPADYKVFKNRFQPQGPPQIATPGGNERR